jgi:hypothetical protein
VVFVSVDADLTTRIDEIEDYDNEILWTTI